MNLMVIKSFSKNFRDSKLNMLLGSGMAFHKPVIRFDHFIMKSRKQSYRSFRIFSQAEWGTIR